MRPVARTRPHRTGVADDVLRVHQMSACRVDRGGELQQPRLPQSVFGAWRFGIGLGAASHSLFLAAIVGNPELHFFRHALEGVKHVLLFEIVDRAIQGFLCRLDELDQVGVRLAIDAGALRLKENVQLRQREAGDILRHENSWQTLDGMQNFRPSRGIVNGILRGVRKME